MNLKHITLLLTAACMALVLACDQQEDIPAYVRVEPFTIDEPGGDTLHDLTDGWFYADLVFLGAYDLPSDIPVLNEGLNEILVFPGIKENGILETPNIYPMMTWHIEDITLQPGKVTVVKPVVRYDPAAIFAWDIDRGTFDGNSTVALENLDSDADLNFILTNVDGFTGKYLQMAVDTAHPVMAVAFEPVTLPTVRERQTWLEMHYRNELPFVLSLIGQTTGQSDDYSPVFQFNVSSEWNKIYINLTDFVAFDPHDRYRLLFNLNLPTTGVNISGKVQIDNVRLVHF
ncbi:MAG: hypothetical protein SFV52_08785 [Saprospiraceae bacterium]|nr:hypothetical protein [Saprospiraceae bacterium]